MTTKIIACFLFYFCTSFNLNQNIMTVNLNYNCSLICVQNKTFQLMIKYWQFNIVLNDPFDKCGTFKFLDVNIMYIQIPKDDISIVKMK